MTTRTQFDATSCVWAVTVSTSGPALERLARALLVTGSSLLPRRIVTLPLGRGVSACLLIDIPASKHMLFMDVCAPEHVASPTGAAP